MEADQHAAFLRHVAHGEARAVAVLPAGPVDRREHLLRLHLADVPQRVLEHALLHRDLRGEIDVLQRAAAAQRRSSAQRGVARLAAGSSTVSTRADLERRLLAEDRRGDALARQRAFDEDRLAVAAGDAAAFLVERFDERSRRKSGFHGGVRSGCRTSIRRVQREERLPVRLARARERRAHEVALRPILLRRQRAAHRLEAQENEIGIDDVGLAVVPDLREPPRLVGVPHLRAVHAELAREPEEPRDLVERRDRPALVEREQIHHVAMTHVIAADVVVVAELAVVVARVPVARRAHAVDQAAVVQHRQIEAARRSRTRAAACISRCRRRSAG